LLKVLRKIDLQVIDFVNKHRNVFLDDFMLFVTRLGNMGLIWLLIAIILLSNKIYHYYGTELLEAIVIGAIICNLVLKPIFERIRPYDRYPNLTRILPRLNDYSFPSGHTLASFSSATILFQINSVVGILSFSLAFLIAYSRLYLNVHYFTDVFFGMIIGILVSLSIIIF